jgi:hypothetical protein
MLLAAVFRSCVRVALPTPQLQLAGACQHVTPASGVGEHGFVVLGGGWPAGLALTG